MSSSPFSDDTSTQTPEQLRDQVVKLRGILVQQQEFLKATHANVIQLKNECKTHFTLQQPGNEYTLLSMQKLAEIDEDADFLFRSYTKFHADYYDTLKEHSSILWKLFFVLDKLANYLRSPNVSKLSDKPKNIWEIYRSYAELFDDWSDISSNSDTNNPTTVELLTTYSELMELNP